MPSNLIGILGIIVILTIAVLFSSNRKAIHLRVVAAAFVLQAVIAAFVLYFDWGRRAIAWLSKGVLAIISYSKAGIDMVFGPLADTDVVGFSFAVNVLPIIIFFLTKVGLVTPEILRKYRKIALVVVLTLSAVITPPDVASQIIVAVPVLLLYQVSINISSVVLKRQAKKARKHGESR